MERPSRRPQSANMLARVSGEIRTLPSRWDQALEPKWPGGFPRVIVARLVEQEHVNVTGLLRPRGPTCMTFRLIIRFHSPQSRLKEQQIRR